MNIDKNELAWAAGFFDGEGTTTLHKHKQNKLGYLRVSVMQFYDPECLHRFQKAVGGLGHVIGPYKRSSSSAMKKDGSSGDMVRYQWYVSSFNEAQQVICYLWPYLSGPKKKQATDNFKEWKRLRSHLEPKSFRVSECIINELKAAKDAGAKQEDLADKYGLHRGTISRLTAGHGKWSRKR